jgi:hypothetical protein
MMPTLVGQVTGFCSANSILFTLSKLFDSVQSSSAKRDTGGNPFTMKRKLDRILYLGKQKR